MKKKIPGWKGINSISWKLSIPRKQSVVSWTGISEFELFSKIYPESLQTVWPKKIVSKLQSNTVFWNRNDKIVSYIQQEKMRYQFSFMCWIKRLNLVDPSNWECIRWTSFKRYGGKILNWLNSKTYILTQSPTKW